MIKLLRYLSIIAGGIVAGCSKGPERLTVNKNDQLITLEWNAITIEKIPVYYKGFSKGNLEYIKKIDYATSLKINEELADPELAKDIWRLHEPQITISENSYNQAINHLSSVLKISKKAAKDALPTKNEWSLSVTHTDQTRSKLESSPELFQKYVSLAKELPSESVTYDPNKLYNFLKLSLSYLQSSKTLMDQVDPNIAYAIRRNSDLSSVILVIFPEDIEWEGINSYYNSIPND